MWEVGGGLSKSVGGWIDWRWEVGGGHSKSVGGWLP